jgi:hypothetical protein
VKALVATLIETISRLEDRVSHLEEQLNQNSQNSSRPPQKMGLVRPRTLRKAKGVVSVGLNRVTRVIPGSCIHPTPVRV